MGNRGKVSFAALVVFIFAFGTQAFGWALWGNKAKELAPDGGEIAIPVETLADYKARYYRVKADDGSMVTFFAVKSRDGQIRAAIDSCDVCFRSGKGYVQDGDHMVCENCGQRFATNRINEVKGGCNPAPLKRAVRSQMLVIAMADINANAWYCQFKQ